MFEEGDDIGESVGNGVVRAGAVLGGDGGAGEGEPCDEVAGDGGGEEEVGGSDGVVEEADELVEKPEGGGVAQARADDAACVGEAEAAGGFGGVGALDVEPIDRPWVLGVCAIAVGGCRAEADEVSGGDGAALAVGFDPARAADAVDEDELG